MLYQHEKQSGIVITSGHGYSFEMKGVRARWKNAGDTTLRELLNEVDYTKKARPISESNRLGFLSMLEKFKTHAFGRFYAGAGWWCSVIIHLQWNRWSWKKQRNDKKTKGLKPWLTRPVKKVWQYSPNCRQSKLVLYRQCQCRSRF